MKTKILALTIILGLCSCTSNYGDTSSSILSNDHSSMATSSSDNEESSNTDSSSSTNSTTSNSTTSTGSSSSSSSTSSSSISSSSSSNDPTQIYYQPDSYSMTLKGLNDSIEYRKLASTDNPKMLVIPVKFTGSSSCASLSGGCNKVKSDIEKTFFGSANETGWESVNSYYKESSYGKLNVTGKVSDWFTIDKTIAQIAALSSDTYADPTFYILRKAVTWYKNNHSDVKDFDQDGDGYIDAVWMVYDTPYDTTGKYDFLWAYVFTDYQNTANPSVNSPIADNYAWASYSFMYDDYYNSATKTQLLDGHTYIHETGHILGLDDYYNYDYVSGSNVATEKANPAGSLDMMDNNIGDQTAYSKMLMNWTMPKVLTRAGEITIEPFASSGDVILVPAGTWNGSAMDEYLAIEFYTPTGLNYKDAYDPYCDGNYPPMYTIPGIKVYHVDSRIGLFNNSNDRFSKYIDSLSSVTSSTYPFIAHSNTPSTNQGVSISTNYRLLHLIEKNGGNELLNHGYASNSTLFVLGSEFLPGSTHKNSFNSGKFNGGEAINYSFKITALDNNSATLKFTKI